MATQVLTVTPGADPVDLVSDLSLDADTTYFCQPRLGTILIHEGDSAPDIADPAIHMRPMEGYEVTVPASGSVYVWAPAGAGRSPTLTVTPA